MSATTRSVAGRTFAALVLSAVVVAGLATASTASGPAGAVSGTKQSHPITIAVDEFPPVLNNMTTAGNGAWTAMIAGPALARGYKLMPDFSYEPWIFAKDCEVTSQSPFTVDCQIRPDAKWSDGVPITSNDFKFTYDTIMNKKNDVVSRDGYDKILAFNVLSPTEFQMAFQEVFAPYRELWAGASTTVLPAHILEGKNFNKVWNSCICNPKTKKPISSGPMLVKSFTPDEQATLVPNQNYWGGKVATVPEVVFVPVRDTNSELNAFRTGDVDVIYPQNQIGLRKKIESVDGAEYTTTLGPQWEHFDMLSTVPGLDDLQVRKAIATAMPRQQIVDRVVKDANENAEVLNNTQYMVNQQQYVPNWEMYPNAGDVDAANALLDAAGWTRGSDGVRQKGKTKLAFTVGTTSGNQARILSEQIMQQQLEKIGVKLTIENSPNILDVNMTGFDFESLIFAWVGGPDPYTGNVIWMSSSIPAQCSKKLAKAYECDYSGQNYTKVKDPTVDSLLNDTNKEADPAVRADLYNQVDKQLATNDVTVIPLFQKPTQLGYRNTIKGLVDNPTQDGFTWNIEDWTYSG
ncbi:MAG TPA: ABC transporter family substrate-binding protein [Acidimicrobiia bacterium]|jgi:peptide/nickel transport system substrate-binding protein